MAERRQPFAPQNVGSSKRVAASRSAAALPDEPLIEHGVF